MKLADRPYQHEAVHGGRGFPGIYRALRENRTALLVLPTGCHVPGQELLRADGTTVRVEDVAVGDDLMGVGGEPRRVLQLCAGDGEMFRITPTKGAPWLVNLQHVLTLGRTGDQPGGDQPTTLVDVTVRDWLSWSKNRRHLHKLVRSASQLGKPVETCMPPYVLGVLLGDGALTGCYTDLSFSKPDPEVEVAIRGLIEPLGMTLNAISKAGRCPAWRLAGRSGPGGNPLMAALREFGLLPIRSEDRFIPAAYLGATRAERLELLAGLIDTDGHLDNGGFDLIFKSRRLADGLAFLARSVGLAACVRAKECYCQTGAGGVYWRVNISGDCRIIPTRLGRKTAGVRAQRKDPLRTGFTIERAGFRSPFFGFTLSGDGRYLLADHTVTHNSGKTVVFSRVAEACVLRGKRVLILAHREELIQGALEKLVRDTSINRLDIGIEMAGERAGDHHAVVIASVPSLKGDRLKKLDASRFGLVIIDEAHHSVSDSYTTIINHFPESKILGVTATPDRLDGKGLGRIYGSEFAYVYEMADAIRDGYLVRIIGEEIVSSSLDLSGVRTTAGDLNQGDLAAVMEADRAVALVARGTVDKAGSRPTIIFAVSVAQAHLIAAYINTYLGRVAAVALDGTAERTYRKEVKERFERGEFQYLVNCALFTEGVDIPCISCVSIGAPTKSRAKYSQEVGRGARLLGATLAESIAAGKSDCLVLDFSGNSGRHKLVTCFDVLDGNADEEVRKRVLKRAAAGPVDALEQLELIPKEIAEEQRLKALRDVSYRTVAMADPFTVLGVHPRAGRYGGRPATMAQVERLAKHKIPGAEAQLKRMMELRPKEVEAIDFGQAEQLLYAIHKRVKAGLCSVRQSKILVEHGMNPDATFEDARWALDRLAQNGWKPTPEILAHPGLTHRPEGE